MRLRQMVGIFLLFGDEVLMIRRSVRQKVAPGLWSNIGGHIEPAEINNPQAACLRELAEETGYQTTEIHELSLGYIVMGVVDNEIYIYYDYFAQANLKRALPPCDEGELAWVRIGDLHGLEMVPSLHLLVEHYLTQRQAGQVYVGLLGQQDDRAKIDWRQL